MGDIANKLLRLNQVKENFKTVFDNNNIDYVGETFEDFPSLVEANIGGGPLIIVDKNNKIYERKFIVEKDFDEFFMPVNFSEDLGYSQISEYVVSGWTPNDSIVSTNVYLNNALMLYGGKRVIGDTYAGTIRSIDLDDENNVFAGGVTTRRVRRFNKFNLEYQGNQSALFDATITKVVSIPSVKQIFATTGSDYKVLRTEFLLNVMLNETSVPSVLGAMVDENVSSTPDNKPVLIVDKDGPLLSFYSLTLNQNAVFLGNLSFTYPNQISKRVFRYIEDANLNPQSIRNIIFHDNNNAIVRRNFRYDGATPIWVGLGGGTASNSFILGVAIIDMVIHNNRIYIITNNGLKIIQIGPQILNPTFSFVADIGLIQPGNFSPTAIAVSDEYIFLAGGQRIVKYSATTFEVIGQSPSYGGTINTIKYKDERIYYGGVGNNRVIKILDMHELLGEAVD